MVKIYGRRPTSEEYSNSWRLYGGNKREFLCEECAAVSRIDPERDPKVCKMCNPTSLRVTRELANTECPKCRTGHFDSGQLSGIS